MCPNRRANRFTVASRTVEGESRESAPSVAVRPNEPLPEGWKESFNAVTGKVCAFCRVLLLWLGLGLSS